MDKRCLKCGKVLNETAVFCGKCGTKYEEEQIIEKEIISANVKKCSQCGEILGETAKFCKKCGTPFYSIEVPVKQKEAVKENIHTSNNKENSFVKYILIIAVLVFIIIGILLIINMDKSDKNSGSFVDNQNEENSSSDDINSTELKTQGNVFDNNDIDIKNAKESAKTLLASIVGTYDDLDSDGSIDIYVVSPSKDNNYAAYSIAGRGFSPFYDTDCIEVDKYSEFWIFKRGDTYYELSCGLNGVYYVSYSYSLEDLKETGGQCCGIFNPHDLIETDDTKKLVRDYVDANFIFVNNIYYKGSLPTTGEIVGPNLERCTTEYFSSFQQLDEYVHSIYVNEKANYFINQAKYFDYNGILCLNTAFVNEKIDIAALWDVYEINIIYESNYRIDFELITTGYGGEEIRRQGTLTAENGYWKLTEPIW